MNITEIQRNDVIFIRIPIGDLPPGKIKKYLDDVKLSFAEKFENEMIIIPIRGNSLINAELEILRKI